MYTELRTHSAFSFLEGASLPEDLVARAAELGCAVIALGDRDGLYGAPRFHKAAQAAGLRAIVACDLQLRPTTNNPTTNNPTTNNLYLLVSTRTGYRNLCRLLTQAKRRAAKGEPAATWDDLEGHTDGLLCLAGGAHSPLAAPLRQGDDEEVRRRLRRLQRLFGSRLYLDVQRHFDPEEERLGRAYVALARAGDLRLVATNDVRHARPEGRPLLDVLTCIRHKTNLDSAGRRLQRNAERHLKSPRQMAALFRDLPEAVANSERLAEECEFTLDDLGYRFPDFPLPPGETPIGHLRRLTGEGARWRYGTISPRVRRQLEHELAVIEKLELAGYFLIVWDIVRYCRERGILAQGRGSAANSAVCYALGITAVDAVGMDLLFERFLSEERGEWPDIDIDLPSGDRREEVIQYVYRRYGERGAAMTANVITYRTRSAVREVGKALGFSLDQVDRLAKLLRRFEFRDGDDELATQLAAGGVDPQTPRVRLLVDLVGRIQNLPRHLGQHSGGMVIAAGRLDEVVPLEPASMPGRVVVQWDKDDCADLGIIKVDLLGLGMMAVLEDAIPLVRQHEGIDLDLAKLPADDPKVYRMLQEADTIGVFQVESRAQMATLPRMRPERFYDLVVEVAIIRPGPIVGQMVHPYLARRAGRAPVLYPHPSLEPILARTLGVPLFQEQLLRMAMVAAGFSGGEAEELRRAMGFKRSMARMAAIETRLRQGMARNGITGAAADDIVRGITSFALYGFPESHAASFALIAYASAYLKAHHPAAFYCALLNNFPMGFYHPATLVKDAQRHGVRVLPVDVMRSAWQCGVEGEQVVGLLGCYVVREESGPTTNNPTTNNLLSLRLGYRYVRGLREEAGKRIEEERARAPFESIEDIAYRCQLRDDELATLAEIGAFAAFGKSRREAMWQLSALPRGPLFERSCGKENVSRRRYGPSEGSIIPRTSGVATVNAARPRLLLSDARASPGRKIWAGPADSPGSHIDPGEPRRGERPRNQEGLSELRPHRAGQPARAGDLSDAAAGDRSRKLSIDRSASGPSGLDCPTPEPPDHLSRRKQMTPNNPTTNNLTTSDLPPAVANLPGCPLPPMSPLDRTLADYRGTGMTVGPHVMTYLRDELRRAGVLSARQLGRAGNGRWVKIAGLVIVRQRPGTARGFCFLTLEDETGTANAVVTPDMFHQHRTEIHTSALLQVEGPLQRVEGVTHVRARRFRPLAIPKHLVQQRGASGYRLRLTADDEGEDLPDSHDYR